MYSKKPRIFPFIAIALALFGIGHLVEVRAGTAPIEAVLCTQVNMETGDYTSVQSLEAGRSGFTVAVTSGLKDLALMKASWEAVEVPGRVIGELLGEDTVVVAEGQTKFIPFRAGPNGLAPGQYRILLVAAGHPDVELKFHARGPEASSAETSSNQAPAQPSVDPGQPQGDETVTQALERVFRTKKGPEATAAGARVISSFLDQELSSSSNKTDPRDVPKEEAATGAEPAPVSQAAIPTPAATALSEHPAPDEATADDSSPSPDVSQAGTDRPAPAQALQNQLHTGVTAILARRLDDQKAPLDTPASFDESDPKVYLALRSEDPNLKDLVKVQWFAFDVEGMAPGRKLGDSDTILRVGAWNSAAFLPPEGGFWPGRYRVVVLKDQAPVAEVDFEIVSPLPVAELLDVASPVEGANLAHEHLGGKMVSATSEQGSSSWAKENLIDGFGYGGKDCLPSCGWASADRKFPQELVFSYRGEAEAQLAGVVMDTESCDGDDKCLQSLPRLVEVWFSNQNPDQGFEQVATNRLRPIPDKHFIPLPGTLARFLKLVIKSNYGSARRTQLAEVSVLEQPGGVSPISDMDIDIALPSLGGALIRYTSHRYGREAANVLSAEPGAKGWWSQDEHLPQELVFGFRDGQQALIDRVELIPDSESDPGSRPKLVTVEVSDTSPIEGFVEASRQEIATQSGKLTIPVDRSARFVKIRILENQGGQYTSLGGVRIIEGKAPDYLSLLSRPTAPITTEGSASTATNALPVTSDVQPAFSAPDAPFLELGKRIKAGFQDYDRKHYYRLKLEGDRPGQLNLELVGQPFLRTKITILDQEGGTVATFTPERNSDERTMISWRLQPGEYQLIAEATPANIVLAWDVSGSMAGHSELLRTAVTEFLEKVRPSEKVNLIPFNDQVMVLLPEFTNNKDELLAAVSGKFKAQMATRLHDAMAKAIKLLRDARGAGVLVVMTDGVDEGSQMKAPEFWQVLSGNPVRIFGLGLGGELKVSDPGKGISGQRMLAYVSEATGGRYIPIPNADQLVAAYKKIAEELVSGTTYYLKPTWTSNPGVLMVEAVGEHIASVAAPPRIELILDASGSMKKKLEGRSRMAVAKEVLKEVIEQLPPEVEVALRVYGHRIREGRKGDCQDTELVYRFAKIDKDALIKQVDGIKPLGTTPIAYSLSQTVGDFGDATGEKTVILVTDGKEECDGNLVTTVEELQAQGLDVRLHVVGFAVKDEQVHAQMQEAAATGKGRYVSAADRTGLKSAIQQTLALPYKVLDSQAAIVARGTAGEETPLPAGYYRVVFETPQGDVVKDEVEVTEAKTTLLRVTKDGPAIGVQVLAPSEAP